MITQHGFWRRHTAAIFRTLVVISITTGLISFTACSGKKSQPIAPATTGDTSGTAGTDPLAPTSSSTTTSTAGTTPSSLIGEGQEQLFDTDLDSSEQTSGSVSSGGSPSSQEQACLSNSFGGYSDSEESQYGDGACVDPSQSGSQYALSEDLFYNSSTLSYNMLDYCLDKVLSRQPQTDEQAAVAHKAGRMFLVRCYQRAVARMQTFLPWGNMANQNYNQIQGNLSILLVNFHIIQ